MGEEETRGGRASFSAVVVMVCTAASRLFGYVRSALIALYFGASGDADALNAVYMIPNNLRKLFAEGAFASAFIPSLATAINEDHSLERSREMVRSLIGFLLVVLVPFVALSLVFPRAFVAVLLQFPDPHKADTAAQLMRWIFNYILLVSLSGLVQAALNTHGSFAVPALSPLLFTAATVLCLVFLHQRYSVLSQGVGVLAGGVLQLAFQLPALRRKGYRFLPSFRFRNPDFVRTIKLWVPYLVSASIVAVNQQIAQLFASWLENGSISAVNNSVLFFQIPIGIFTASIVTVLFPRMSRQVADGDTAALRGSVSYGVESILVLLVPSSILLALFGREIISALLQRGAFSADNTLMTSRALTGYAVGLVSMGLYTFLQRFFYSLKSFAVPLYSAGFVAAVDVAASLVLIRTPLRVSGLAYANSISFTAGFILLLALALRRLGSLEARSILLSLGKALLGSIPMAAGLVLFLRWKPDLWLHGGGLRAAALICAVAAAAVAVTLAAYVALRVPFLMELYRRRARR